MNMQSDVSDQCLPTRATFLTGTQSVFKLKAFDFLINVLKLEVFQRKQQFSQG